MSQVGRPSGYSDAIALKICERLVDGESLRAICADAGMPSQSMVFRWLEHNDAFREQYARAREMQADTLADDILHIADTPQEGIRTKITDKGEETTRGDMIDHRRLQVDARKWIASKLRPKKYGDRIEHEHSGKIGLEQLVTGSFERTTPSGD